MSRYRSLALVAAVTLAAACRPNPNMTDATRDQVAGEIRAAADSVFAGLERLDPSVFVDQLSAVRMYGENTMVYPGVDSLASDMRRGFGALRSMHITTRAEPVVVALGPDAGVFSSQVHWTMTDTTGTAMSFDGVWTLVYQRLDGRWKVVLGHDSYAVAEAAEET